MKEPDEQQAEHLYEEKTLEELEQMQEDWNQIKEDVDYNYGTLKLAIDFHIDSKINQKISEIQQLIKPHYGVRTIYDDSYFLTVTNPKREGVLSNFPVMKQVALTQVFQPIAMNNGMVVEENYEEINAENTVQELRTQISDLLSAPTREFEETLEQYIRNAFEMAEDVEKSEAEINTGGDTE